MKRLIPLYSIAISVGFGIPAAAQPLPPEQMIKKHLAEAGANMVEILPKIAFYGEAGSLVTQSGWQVIRTSKTSSVGQHDTTGLIALFEADPNEDGSSDDARFLVLQPFEGVCPSDIETDSRMKAGNVQQESISLHQP
jgi:hypothetical protein